MISLREIMSADVVAVEPEATLREVASLLSTEHIGGVPVVAGERLLGVVSATDLLEFEATAAGAPLERGQQVEWDEWTEPVEWEEGEEPPAAYFTDLWADAGADLVERFEETDRPEWDVMDEHTASEIMTRSLISLPPDASVREAASRMLEADVRRVLVLEQDRLVGVVTSRDAQSQSAASRTSGRAPRSPSRSENRSRVAVMASSAASTERR